VSLIQAARLRMALKSTSLSALERSWATCASRKAQRRVGGHAAALAHDLGDAVGRNTDPHLIA
jgi:hypothetical protein